MDKCEPTFEEWDGKGYFKGTVISTGILSDKSECGCNCGGNCQCGAKPVIYQGTFPPTNYKYKEQEIINDFWRYIDDTYGEHYKTDKQLDCFDVWLALGDATPTFRNTAMKYLWRLGKKEGTSSRKDLFKAMHYVLMCLYNECYKEEKIS
jgi:hypothetical protein